MCNKIDTEDAIKLNWFSFLQTSLCYVLKKLNIDVYWYESILTPNKELNSLNFASKNNLWKNYT